MPVIGSPVVSTDLEGLILDGLTLNDDTFGLASLDLTPPRQRADWVGSADSEYATLFRDPFYENRTIVARISITPQTDMDPALEYIAQVRDKLAEASKSQDGLELEWTPIDGTQSVTFDVLSGEITDLPIDWENGWLSHAPAVTITMTAKPYWRRSTETTISAVAAGTSPITTVEIPAVGGDAPALGRVIVTNTGTTSLRWVEWGLEQRGYNSSSPASLVLDSDSLVTSGFAGTGATRAGAYDPGASGNSVVRATAAGTPTALCGTGTQPHVGRFRVTVSVYTTSDQARFRLTWRAGDGGYRSNAWASPVQTSGFVRVDLGVIDIEAATLGTQAWDGWVEAYTMDASAATVDVDFLALIPVADGYGRSRTVTPSTAGVLSAWDAFTGTTAAGTLNARAAPAGGSWATSGAATDFTFIDANASDPGDLRSLQNPSEAIIRTATGTSPRYAILGSSITDQIVECRFGHNLYGQAHGECGLIARWTDSSNYLRYTITPDASNEYLPATLTLVKVVAGVATVLATSTRNISALTPLRLGLTVRADGTVDGTIYDANSNGGLRRITASDTALATAGTLASGKQGIYDTGIAFATSRWYDDFYVSVPPAEPVIAYPSRGYQARHDDTFRESSGGGTWGTEASYRGRRVLIPPAGTNGRASRVAVRANTANLEAAAMTSVTASYTVAVAYTERGLVVPRA